MSLELSRIVNDALQRNDYEAAFAPLSEQPDLRPSELPTVEKKSLAALAGALKEERHAQVWVAALFSPHNSVHLFAYKTLLRLGAALKLLAEPLQRALEKRWQSYHRETSQEEPSPLPPEGMGRIVEVFFCADPPLALSVAQQQAKIYGPIAHRRNRISSERYRRGEAARKVREKAMSEIRREDTVRQQQAGLGPYILASPSVLSRAEVRPDVVAAFEAVGPELPPAPYSAYPHRDCHEGLARIALAKAEPQKTVRAFLQEPLRESLKAAFQSDQACEESLASSLVNASFFDESFRLQLVPFLIDIVQKTQTRQELAESSRSGMWPLTLRASLWKTTFDRLMQTYDAAPSLEQAQQLYPLLRVLGDPNRVGGRCFRMRERYGAASFEPTGEEAPQPVTGSHPPVAPPTRTVTMPTPQYPDAPKLKPPATRLEGEDAVAFLLRAWSEYRANLGKLSEAAIAAREAWMRQRDAGVTRDYPQSAGPILEQHERFKGTLKALDDADKRAILLYLARGSAISEINFLQLGLYHVWADNNEAQLKQLTDPIAPQLWENCAQALQEMVQRIKDGWGISAPASEEASARGERIRHRFQDVKAILTLSQGPQAHFRLFQMALKLRARALAQSLEEEFLLNLRRDALDERWQEPLAHLANRVPQWTQARRRQGYTQLALGFYLLQTPEGRRRSWEFAALSEVVNADYLVVVESRHDTEAWAELLCAASQKDARFFELWREWRKHPAPRERVFYDLLNVLPRVLTEQSVAMVLPMLAEFTPEERASHVANWAQTLEHPHPKIAKWAFETLLALSHPTLNWEAASEAAGDKLWSENLGLTKVAARFLGTVPVEYASLAWDKLSDALELENTALVEAILKAMIALLSKDPSLRLSDAARERLASVAQLAPERFGPLQRRLRTAFVTT